MKYNKRPIAGYLITLFFTGLAISCSKDQVLDLGQTTLSSTDLHIKAVKDGNYPGEIILLE
jgi:hypothetical protein